MLQYNKVLQGCYTFTHRLKQKNGTLIFFFPLLSWLKKKKKNLIHISVATSLLENQIQHHSHLKPIFFTHVGLFQWLPLQALAEQVTRWATKQRFKTEHYVNTSSIIVTSHQWVQYIYSLVNIEVCPRPQTSSLVCFTSFFQNLFDQINIYNATYYYNTWSHYAIRQKKDFWKKQIFCKHMCFRPILFS